jgi:hypothetical protein
MIKLTITNVKLQGLKVQRYTEQHHTESGENKNYEIFRLGGHLPENNSKPVLVRFAYNQEVAFSDEGNAEAMQIMEAANESGGIFTEEDAKAYAELMKRTQKKSIFNDIQIPYTPNNNKDDKVNNIHDSIENGIFAEQ